jgi:hypothetical protein
MLPSVQFHEHHVFPTPGLRSYRRFLIRKFPYCRPRASATSRSAHAGPPTGGYLFSNRSQTSVAPQAILPGASDPSNAINSRRPITPPERRRPPRESPQRHEAVFTGGCPDWIEAKDPESFSASKGAARRVPPTAWEHYGSSARSPMPRSKLITKTAPAVPDRAPYQARYDWRASLHIPHRVPRSLD